LKPWFETKNRLQTEVLVSNQTLTQKFGFKPNDHNVFT